MAERLAPEHRRLDELDHDNVGVRAIFAVCVDHLAASEDPWDRRTAAAYALLSVADGPDIGLPAAARLLDLPEYDAERVLERLVDLHLVETTAPGRYRAARPATGVRARTCGRDPVGRRTCCRDRPRGRTEA